MHRPPLLILAATLLVACAPFANAGTADDPEVADGAEETHASLDIQKLWITANATMVFINVAVAELPAVPDGASLGVCADPGCAGVSLSYRVEVSARTPDGELATAIPDYHSTYLVYRHGGPEGLRSIIGYTTLTAPDTAIFNGTVDVSVAGNVITFEVPRGRGEMPIPVGETPGAYSLTELEAYDSPQFCNAGLPSQVPVCASVPVIPPNPSDPQAVRWDSAPDTGTSRPFVFAEPAAPVTPPPTPTPTPTSTPTTPTTSGAPSPGPVPPGSPSPPGSSATDPSDTSSTEEKKSPAPSALVALAAVGAAMAVIVARKRAP